MIIIHDYMYDYGQVYFIIIYEPLPINLCQLVRSCKNDRFAWTQTIYHSTPMI